MNWLNFFYNKTTQLRHSFGRGINATISPNEEELFHKSYKAFEKQEILQAYEYFFKSLENFSNEISNHNIVTNLQKDKLDFTIYQGNAKITGYVTKEHLYAEAIIIKKDDADVPIKRYILERNYQLTYAYYFSDDKYIKLKLFHDNITVSPQKIFFPLREIALNADFDKEFLKSEFSKITLQDTEHLHKLSTQELEIKYSFLHQWIDELEKKILTLPTNDNAGMQAFLYLNILFKIDYLLVPKCEIFQKISKKVQIYFSDDTMTTESKNAELKAYITTLKEMDFQNFSTKFYSAKYTFNPMEKTSQEEISNFISESLLKIRWYKSNRYNQIIPTIYSYISFYIFYNYGLNPVIKSLLHTLVEIQNPAFFNALEYAPLYDENKESFAQKAIISKIEDAITPFQSQYKSLELFGDELNFSSMNELSNSFLLQIKHLNFEEI